MAKRTCEPRNRRIEKSLVAPKVGESYLNLPHELFEVLEVVLRERFRVCESCRVVLLTVRANVLVDEVGLALQNADTLAVEPILAFVAADVEPEEWIC